MWALPFLNIVPVFDCLAALEPEDFEPDISTRKIVLCMCKDEIPILESTHYAHFWQGLRESLKMRRKALATFLQLRVMLYVFCFIDDCERPGITGFDAFEQCPDLIFLCDYHVLLADSNEATINAKTDDTTRRRMASLSIFDRFVVLNRAYANIGMDKIAPQKLNFSSALSMFEGRTKKSAPTAKAAIASSILIQRFSS